MILVDSSVWIDHLRKKGEILSELLLDSQVMLHPFVIGELACGQLENRAKVLGALADMPCSPLATEEEMLIFIESNKLMGRGIGYVDAHLLAAACLKGNVWIFTHDKALKKVATELGVAYRPTIH